MISVKSGNGSQRNCHRCTAETACFNRYKTEPLRRGEDTAALIKRHDHMKSKGYSERAKLVLKDMSLSAQLPAILNFPFGPIHKTNDMHALFPFESLHNLHLGISKDLKKCLAERLRSDTLQTNALPTRLGKYRKASFKTVRMTILNDINNMLAHMQKSSPAHDLRIDFSHGGKDKGAGIYTEDGMLIGMLEGKDYKSLDMVSPFIGMFVDRCCGEVDSATTTKVFAEYVDMTAMMLCYDGDPMWSPQRIAKLEVLIRKFKKDTVSLYRDYQNSQFKTEKFHLLDHVCQDIKQLGGIKWGDASLFEHYHILVENAYRATSRRRSSAMKETLVSLMRALYVSSLKETMAVKASRNIAKSKTFTTARKEAMHSDAASLVRRRKIFLLSQLEKCRQVYRKLRKAKDSDDSSQLVQMNEEWKEFDVVVRNIVEDVGEDGTRVLLGQTEDQLNLYDIHDSNVRIRKVSSGYVTGRKTPTSLHQRSK